MKLISILCIIGTLLVCAIVVISTMARNKQMVADAFSRRNKSLRAKRERIVKKIKKTDEDYKELGADEKQIKESKELADGLVDDSSDGNKEKSEKEKKDDDQLKDMLKSLLMEEALGLGIEYGMTAAEKALKNMRSASAVKDLLDESNMKMKQSLKELEAIDFDKLPDGPEKVKLKSIVEESKKQVAEVLENSTYDKLLGTSDLTPNEVPSADDAKNLSTTPNSRAAAETGTGMIDPLSGNRASMKLDELSDSLTKQLDKLDGMKSYLKANNITFDTFTRNNAIMYVDNAKDGVKHFTDTQFLQQTRRLKQMLSDSAAGRAGRQAMQEASGMLNKRMTKGIQFINDCMNSSLGKGLKEANRAGKEAIANATSAASDATSRASRTATKKLGKEVLSEAGGMGIGAVVAVGIEIFSQLIESGSIDGEQLKEVLKEEATAMAVEAGIMVVATAGVMAATGMTAGAAAAATFGPVGMVLAAASIGGAILDASPAGKKFVSLLFAKDLHGMKQNYDEAYAKYYSFNKYGFKRRTVTNWAGGKDIVIEGNFLELDDYGDMTDTAIKEFTGFLAEYYEMNNLTHGPNTMDVLLDVRQAVLEEFVRSERYQRARELRRKAEKKITERGRKLLFASMLQPSIQSQFIKNKLKIAKAELNTLRAKSKAIERGGFNASQRIMITMALKKLGYDEKKILRLMHPDY